LSPLTMEALQMMKFYYKKERLNFTLGWMTAEKEMIDDLPDEELTVSLLKGDQKAMDTIMGSIKIDEGKLKDMRPIENLNDEEKPEN